MPSEHSCLPVQNTISNNMILTMIIHGQIISLKYMIKMYSTASGFKYNIILKTDLVTCTFQVFGTEYFNYWSYREVEIFSNIYILKHLEHCFSIKIVMDQKKDEKNRDKGRITSKNILFQQLWFNITVIKLLLTYQQLHYCNISVFFSKMKGQSV